MITITDDYEGLNTLLQLILGSEEQLLDNNIQIPERLYDYFSSYIILQTQQNISDQYLNRQLKTSDKNYIVQNFKLSEQLIEHNLKYLNNRYICTYQTLSEDFIRRHKDKVDWNHITRFQILSDEFKYEFQDYLDSYLLTIREYESYENN